MSNSIDSLKLALEFERLACAKYEEAVAVSAHAETREALQGYIREKQKLIDSLHWIIMAEAGNLEKSDAAPKESGATRLTSGKCPFSAGELNKMGFNVTEKDLVRKE